MYSIVLFYTKNTMRLTHHIFIKTKRKTPGVKSMPPESLCHVRFKIVET